MRTHKLNKLFFVMSFMAVIALTLPCVAQRGEGRGGGGGQGNRGGGDAGGRSAASSRMSAPSGAPRASTQASPRSSAIQSTPRSFNPPGGGGSDRSRSVQGEASRARSSDSANVPRTFRQDGVTVPNRTPDLRIARGTERDDGDRDSRQQQSFFRGSPDRTIRDFRDQTQQLNLDRDRDRNRDRFTRDFTGLRSDWNYRNRSNVPFRFGWWDNYRGDRWPVYGPWASARWRDRPYYWWNWTTASALTPWFAFGWNQPYYWNYGAGGNIYYQDDYVYYDGRQYEPVASYYDRIYALAHSVPKIDAAAAESIEWQPLGVFVATDDERSGERSLQLAVTREGVIGGTYYNNGNGHVHPISGMIDKNSQRAAWAFADGEHPKVVFETSIFNLTNDQTTMMVHFGPRADETEVWNLVRMEQPSAEGVLPGNAPPKEASRNQLP